ncbi:hypothetical protein I6A84_39425 [Frankia sp. CNm7]|uniref:Uncharacterized protein n=1 Tax=Frankia nepalensis TaxID=1836974 RepID=A0A937RQD3_9ACTN|nr:hypothetical protein [Frankia nepalensis]MBL7495586.1 hypothetical protein [Frankia nepalensis]MBL7508832.1 hypothetical protein [Frankia nepalensis]MBL7523959.1 hypothetical protein [Frankia nepalensis]MBL7630056.1 hypothetical protein [Frankia nepalensis]
MRSSVLFLGVSSGPRAGFTAAVGARARRAVPAPASDRWNDDGWNAGLAVWGITPGTAGNTGSAARVDRGRAR